MVKVGRGRGAKLLFWKFENGNGTKSSLPIEQKGSAFARVKWKTLETIAANAVGRRRNSEFGVGRKKRSSGSARPPAIIVPPVVGTGGGGGTRPSANASRAVKIDVNKNRPVVGRRAAGRRCRERDGGVSTGPGWRGGVRPPGPENSVAWPYMYLGAPLTPPPRRSHQPGV